MSQFKLGPFNFINLTVPVGVKERIAREVRSGVDGTTFWMTGRRGEPFVCQSVVDCPTVAAAGGLLSLYHQAVGLPADMIWGGFPVSALFLILDVQALPRGMYATCLGIGGVNGTSQAMLHAAWVLEAIDPTQDVPFT